MRSPVAIYKSHSCGSGEHHGGGPTTLSNVERPPQSLLPHEEVDFEICLLIRQFNLLELDLSGQRVSRKTGIRLRITRLVVVVDPFLNAACSHARLRVKVVAGGQDPCSALLHQHAARDSSAVICSRPHFLIILLAFLRTI